MTLASYAFAGPLAPCWALTDSNAVGGDLPRIDERNLEGVAFLYRTVPEALERARLGGSAFIVGRLIEGSFEAVGRNLYAPYLVSNRHVVFEGSACVATINRGDGGPPDVWDLDQEAWVAHPNGDDVAVAPLFGRFDTARHKATFIREDQFLDKKKIADFDVGVGDDVFMIGRFINLQGELVNIPAVRFGNISVMNTGIPVHEPGRGIRIQESYAVEMRSRTGFSGSPVAVYRTPVTSLKENTNVPKHFWGLLGINWGYVKDEEGENTWLNGVVPAWKISDVLNTPALMNVQRLAVDGLHELRDRPNGDDAF